MTRPEKNTVTDADTADRQFGQNLARRWGVSAQSDRRRSAIRISARKLRVFAVSGGRARLSPVTVPRATQQTVSASVAATDGQPIAPPNGAPEALQIWREREQAALAAELAEQQAHEEAVARASRRRALRSATRQLPSTEARTPGATMAGISPREIKVARPAEVAAIGKLPAQPKLNANTPTAARPPVAAATTTPPRATRTAAGPVDTKSSLVRRSDEDADDSEDDTRASAAKFERAQPATTAPVAQPWRSPQGRTVSAALQQSALNATAAQNLAADEDLGLDHPFNADADEPEPAAEPTDRSSPPAPAPPQPKRASVLRRPGSMWDADADPATPDLDEDVVDGDDDPASTFANLFDESPGTNVGESAADEPTMDAPETEAPETEVPETEAPETDAAPEPEAPQPVQQQSKQPTVQQPKRTPVVRRPGSMWDADADPASPESGEDVVDDDDGDLAPAFANLFDESPDTNVGMPEADEPQADEPHAGAAETGVSPEPAAPQPVQQRSKQPTVQPPPRRTPAVRRPGSMWDADADPASPDLDEDVVDEDDDLASAFANLFDESPDASLGEPAADEPTMEASEPDASPEPTAPRPMQQQAEQQQAMQPKRTPEVRRPGSMWDADADPVNPDLDADVVDEDDDLTSAFAQLFDESPEPTPVDVPQIQQPPMPSRTIPAWDEDADVAATGAPDDDLAPAFAQLFDEEGTPPAVAQQASALAPPAVPKQADQDEDGSAGLGIDGLFDDGTDPSPAPAPVQPPPGWRPTPPSTRSVGLVPQPQPALTAASTSTALLDAPPRQLPKRSVALSLAHSRGTSIAMPELLTAKRATGWMTTTRPLTTGFVTPQPIEPSSMPTTRATGGAFLADAVTTAVDPADGALPETSPVADPPAVPDIVRQVAAGPRRSVRELIAHYEGTAASSAAGTPAGTGRAAGLLGNLPRALTVAPPRISVQPDQPAAAEPEAIEPTASATPSSTRPASTPQASAAAHDAAFAALATKIVGPPTPPGARPALPTPIGGPSVSSPQTTTRTVTRRRRGDGVAPPAETTQVAFPEISQGSQAERLDALVDRVVERIEQRVIDELERRGRRHSRGVF